MDATCFRRMGSEGRGGAARSLRLAHLYWHTAGYCVHLLCCGRLQSQYCQMRDRSQNPARFDPNRTRMVDVTDLAGTTGKAG